MSAPTLRRRLRRQRTRLNRLLRIPPETPPRHQPDPVDPDPLPEVPLWAVLTTFLEADVIGATVRNLETQGCDRVLVIDDGSDDDTVAEARAAGAEILEVARSEHFDEGRIRSRERAWTVRCFAESGLPNLWWLHVDADEFPAGDDGRTVRQVVDDLDRRYRTVGARSLIHLPVDLSVDRPAYRPGLHPVDCQPLHEPDPFRYCGAGHDKHPLLRFDRGAPLPVLGHGRHVPLRYGGRRLVEPTSSLWIHHLQFRDPDVTRARMARMQPRLIRAEPLAKRIAFVDAVYRGDWEQAPLIRGRFGDRPPRPRPWTGPVHRWYETPSPTGPDRR